MMEWTVMSGDIIPESRGPNVIVRSEYVYGTGGNVTLIARELAEGEWTGMAQWGAPITEDGVVASGYAVEETRGHSAEEVLGRLYEVGQ